VESESEIGWEVALMYGYLAELDHDPVAVEAVAKILNGAIAGISRSRHWGLCGGLSGLGWVIHHLSSRRDEGPRKYLDDEAVAAVDALLDAIDQKLIEALSTGEWRDPFDQDNGLAGIGTYFIERWPGENGRRGLALIVDHLVRSSEVSDLGITWPADPIYLGISAHNLQPGVYFGLGLSDGVPGIIHFLGECWAADVRRDTCMGLLQGLSWLFSQAPPKAISRFGPWVMGGYSPSASRLAWCHGDLGIAAVMFQIARRLQRADWRRAAQELLEGCLERPADISGMADATLCHGSAGVAHVFNRLYQTEGDLRCRDAARSWFEWILTTRAACASMSGGISSIEMRSPLTVDGFRADLSLRRGEPGIALALLAAATSIPPDWDRMIFLSGTPWPIGQCTDSRTS
jgi:lantibiotic biosynthesis protein